MPLMLIGLSAILVLCPCNQILDLDYLGKEIYFGFDCFFYGYRVFLLMYIIGRP